MAIKSDCDLEALIDRTFIEKHPAQMRHRAMRDQRPIWVATSAMI